MSTKRKYNNRDKPVCDLYTFIQLAKIKNGNKSSELSM